MSKPPLSYYGGKQNMLNHILPIIPIHEIYVEPFFGGGAVFFAKKRVNVEVINDTNDNLINFYRVIQSDFGELNELIVGTLHSESDYLKAARIYKGEEKADPIWRAWAIWVQCNMSFGSKILGGFAYNCVNIGKWSFPNGQLNKRIRFTEFRNIFRQTYIFSRSFVDIPEIYNKKESFYYIDPPYLGSNCGHYSWDESREIELLEWVEKLNGRFLLSGYPNDIRAEYISRNGWHYKEISQNISVSGIHNAGKTKTETLTWNYNEPGKSYTLF